MTGARVPRTCTPVSGQRRPDRREAGASARAGESGPLSAHRDDSAYVLLGDPGAGKSTAFRCEYEALGGERAHLIAARDFRTHEPRTEWRGKTLFIDGLDEVRAWAPDASTPFDAIRERLRRLGRPRFRLSCRAADWLGANDRRHLASVSPGNRVTVLALDPLTSDDARRILEGRDGPSEAAAFIESARDRGLDAMLSNPQSLGMLADAVGAGGEWPASRGETFEQACRSMAEETNEEHANALEDWYAPPDVLVDAAGRLCAGLLLADRDGYSLRPSASDVRYPLFHGCVAEPEGSPESAAGAARTAPDGARRLLRRALRTRLFTSPAADGRYSPAHRHVAEFLAARHAARLIEAGLPARRVLALIVGGDGTVVTALRGFSGWLAALCRCSGVRRELIDRDPVGVALYGDAAGFSTDDKRRLLRAVHRDASRLVEYPSSSGSRSFVTADLKPALREILTDPDRGREQQSFVYFVLRASAAPLPGLSELLLDIVRDSGRYPDVRAAALQAFIRTAPGGQDTSAALVVLLDELHRGITPDPDDGLRQMLLSHLFPDGVTAVGGAGLSHEPLNQRTSGHEPGRPLQGMPDRPIDPAGSERQCTWIARDESRRQDLLQAIRSQETALRENRCPPGLLRPLAAAWFGLLPEVTGDDAVTRLRNLLAPDTGLVNAALAGLRGAPTRADVPAAEDVIRRHAAGEEYHLALPVLAGLAEIDAERPAESPALDERRLRSALAFGYTTPVSGSDGWYRRVVRSRPEVVGDVLRRYASAELRRGTASVPVLYALAHDDDHGPVAARAALPLLRSFPTRCRNAQVDALTSLLWVALRWADRSELRRLIERKLGAGSMNDAQRTQWLAAGLVTEPERWRGPVEEFVRGRDARVRRLAAFFVTGRGPRLTHDMRAPELALLIRLLGPVFGPRLPRGTTGGSLDLEASIAIGELMDRLAASPDRAAGDALADLSSDRGLSAWRDALVRARDAQRVVRRDATFRPPSIEEVRRTLANGPPANAGDLAALLLDRLRDIAEEVRTDNTNGWRLFWNEGQHRRPHEPKHENSCRDALLLLLRERLAGAADAQPEGNYANDRRADIRVARGSFQVPIEIKKDSHPDLWSALHDQLIAHYTLDPATDGYGIYLVFRFGEGGPPPPDGPPPRSAGELETRLTESLSAAEARRVSVCVIDVSRPAAAGTIGSEDRRR